MVCGGLLRHHWHGLGLEPPHAARCRKGGVGLCEGPQARLWACGAEITIAVARGPRGAFACQWADPRMARQACEGAIAKCRASYPAGDFGRERVWLALVLDARRGLMYQH